MFKVLQAHEEVEPKAVLKKQSKRAQKRLLREEARKQELPNACEAMSLVHEGLQRRSQNGAQSTCCPGLAMDSGYDAALSMYQEVFRDGDIPDPDLLEDMIAQLQRLKTQQAHTGPSSAASYTAISYPSNCGSSTPCRHGDNGSICSGGGASGFFSTSEMGRVGAFSPGPGLAAARGESSAVDFPPGPGPGLARWPSGEPVGPAGQVAPVWVAGRSASLPLTAAAVGTPRSKGMRAVGGAAGRRVTGSIIPSHVSPTSSCAPSPRVRSPHTAPSLGDTEGFPELRPAASPAPHWVGVVQDDDVSTAGSGDFGDGGWAGAETPALKGRNGTKGPGRQRGGPGARHGRSAACGIKVLNMAQPHTHHSHLHHHHHYPPGHSGRNGVQGSVSVFANGHHAQDGVDDSDNVGDIAGGAGSGGSGGGELNVALLWELLEGGLLLRADPLAGPAGDDGGLVGGPDSAGLAVIRRLAQAQCDSGGDGPARGVSPEEMMKMMARAHRRQRRRQAGRAEAGTGAGGAGAQDPGGRDGEDSSSTEDDDEAHLYLDRDESKSWRRTMEWMERNDWLRVPENGKHFKFRRMLPNGQLQTQTVCCTPSDAMRGVRNLQAELARKDAAANAVIRAWRQQQRQLRKEAAAAAAAAAAAEDD